MTRTFCRICEAACGLRLAPSKGSGDPPRLIPDGEHPVSRGYVCAKGTRFGELANHPERLVHPYIRGVGGRLVRSSWRNAIDYAASAIKGVIASHGPHAVGLYYGNPLAFNTVGNLAAGLFANAIGTRNVFGAGSQDCNNKFAGAEIIHGSPLIHPIPDLDHCDLAIFFGTNPAVSQTSFFHLHGGTRLLDAMTERGAELCFVDVRETESASRWGETVCVRPGTDVWLILALLQRLAPADLAAVDHQTGLEELIALARTVTLKKASALTGLPQKRIRDLAKRIQETPRVAMHMSVGVNMGPFGTLAYVALQALMFVTGNLDRRGGNLFHPLAPRVADLARRFGLGARRARSRIGGFRPRLDTLPGGVLADEITTEGPGQIRALICLAGDPVNSIPGSDRLSEALGELDLVVSIDLFENATGRAADVLLPATSWLERWDVAMPGLLLQHSKLAQVTDGLLAAPGECRPEIRILADLSRAIGRPLGGSHLAALALGRLPRARLPRSLARRALGPTGYGLKVPVPQQHSYLGVGPRTRDHKLRFWHSDLSTEPARLRRWEEDYGADDAAPSFFLVGRRRKIGHNSWVHGGVRSVRRRDDCAWMHPADAAALGAEDGSSIRIGDEARNIVVRMALEPTVTRGTVVVPHGLPSVNVNRIIRSGADMLEPVSGQHIMTGIPVRVQAA